jgi:hypothetical protein
MATFNLYALWWLGRTWWQLKQEDKDAGKRPIWHVLAMLVPIYGYFRFHAHMRTIRSLARTPAAQEIVSPLAMTTAWIVINLLGAVALRPDEPAWLVLLSSVLCGALFGYAQHGLNAAWLSLPGPKVSARIRLVHWIVLILGTFWYGIYLLLLGYEDSIS